MSIEQNNPNQTLSQTQNSPSLEPDTSKPRSLLRFWPGLVVVIVILLLAGLYQFTIRQFNSTVNVDHAQHKQASPNVHPIVHIRQKLLVGINPNKPPFSFKPDGELVGFDVDLGKAIARELNVPIEFVEFDFRPSISTTGLGSSNPLIEDSVDIVVSGITVNRARQQYYSFSKPYLSAGLVAITPSASTTIQQASDLSQKRLGVIEHHPAIDYAKTVTTEDNIVVFASNDEAIDAVLNATIDALIIEAPVAQSITLINPSTHIATDLLTNEDYAVMVMRGEDDLTDEIDKILNQLRQKGVLESLRHKWLE